MKQNKQPLFSVIGLVLIALFAVACTAAVEPAPQPTPSDPDQPVNSTDPTPLPLPTPDTDKVTIGKATVETVDLLILESFPVQVHARVTGYLGDGCTEVGPIEQTLVGNTFHVTIATIRPTDAICTQILLPLETTMPLDVLGLPAGEYIVDVNGVTATFSLEIDNVLLPDSMSAPEAVLAARETLAEEVNVEVEEITIGSFAPVEWPNACLGVAVEDQMCAEVITPGYMVTFEINGTYYTYHTNADGSQVVQAKTSAP